jgi:hypothetical protein
MTNSHGQLMRSYIDILNENEMSVHVRSRRVDDYLEKDAAEQTPKSIKDLCDLYKITPEQFKQTLKLTK